MLPCVFPGQGSQKVGMGRHLAEECPICRDTFAEVDEALGESLSALRFEGPREVAAAPVESKRHSRRGTAAVSTRRMLPRVRYPSRMPFARCAAEGGT